MASKARWAVGFNMPGYMPDNEPSVYSNWRDAHAALVSELRYSIDNGGDDESALLEAAASAEAMRKYSEFGMTAGTYHYWLSRV